MTPDFEVMTHTPSPPPADTDGSGEGDEDEDEDEIPVTPQSSLVMDGRVRREDEGGQTQRVGQRKGPVWAVHSPSPSPHRRPVAKPHGARSHPTGSDSHPVGVSHLTEIALSGRARRHPCARARWPSRIRFPAAAQAPPPPQRHLKMPASTSLKVSIITTTATSAHVSLSR